MSLTGYGGAAQLDITNFERLWTLLCWKEKLKLKNRDSEAVKKYLVFFLIYIYISDEKGVRENKGSVHQETPGIQEKQHAKGNVIKSSTVHSDNGHTNHGFNDGV